MKSILLKVFNGILTGLGIGYLSTIIVSVLVNKGVYYPTVAHFTEVSVDAVIKQAIIMALMGVIGSVSSEIYKVEKISLLNRSLIQFVIIVTGVLVMGTYLGWIKSVVDAIGTFILASIIFIVIWVVLYLGIKKEIESINEKLQLKNK